MKRIFLTLALLLLPSLAFAQCNGVFPAQTACGTVAGGIPGQIPFSVFGGPGGSTGQVQTNNGSGGFAGITATALVGLINSGCQVSPTTCATVFGYAMASWWGVKCDGSTDDGPAFNTALAAINYSQLYVPATTTGCNIATSITYNSWSAPGIFSVPGIKLIGQGRIATALHAGVANGYIINTNPAWSALHKSMFVITVGTSGSLAANTYQIETTVTAPGSNEIYVSFTPRVVVTSGATGSMSITLQPMPAGYCYNIYIGANALPDHYATVAAADAICLAGNQTVVITAIGSAHAFPTNKRATWQESQLSNITIDNPNATANASGVSWFRVAYSTMTNVYMRDLTGDGLDIFNWTGDADGSLVVTIDQSKFDNIAGTCVNTGGNSLSFSNFTVSNSVFNLCGTLPVNYGAGFAISAITNANPGVLTYTGGTTIIAGDQIFIQAVAGMALPSGMYRACGTVVGNVFSICDLNNLSVNTTALGAYTPNSGQMNLEWRPPQMQANGNGTTISGAIAYTGLISNWINNGFTQNKNYDFYLTEAGSNDNATFISNDMENTYGKGLYAAAAINLTWNNGECLSTASIGETRSCMQLGSGGLSTGNVTNAQINNIKVRSDSGTSNGFEQTFGGGAIHQNTVSVTNVAWTAWAGINKYVGFLGNPGPIFWARFDGKTGGTCTVKDSYNITSCVRNGVGDYTLTFTSQPLDINYAFSGIASNTGTAIGLVRVVSLANLAANAVEFNCVNLSSAVQDCDYVSVIGNGNPN